MRGLRIWMMVLALLGGALLFACGGDDDDADGGDVDQPTATEEADGGDGGADGGQDTDGGDDASSDLRDLAGKLANKEVKATYQLSGTSDGESLESSFTLYLKPPDTWRVDFSSEGTESIFISKAGTGYLCSAEGGEGTCLESPVGSAAPIPFLDLFTNPESFSSTVDAQLTGLDIERSSREIAGQDATCFSASGEVEGEQGSVEYCFSDDGILLLVRGGGEDTGEFSIEATSIEGSVTDADFEPPYEVLDIGAP